jgi:hypothetical protein
MKLCARQVNNGKDANGNAVAAPAAVMIDASQWDDDIGSDPLFQVIGDSDTVPTDYIDVSSIDNFADWGENAIGKTANFMDWKCLRDEIKSRVTAIAGADLSTWSSLSASEKQHAIKYLPTTVIDQQGYVFYATEGGTGDHIDAYLDCATKARARRIRKLVKYAYEKLGRADGLQAEDDADVDRLFRKYVQRGVLNTAGEPFEGLEDWLRANTGTAYNTTGLQAKIDDTTYSIKDATTTQDFIDSCVDILNGLY